MSAEDRLSFTAPQWAVAGLEEALAAMRKMREAYELVQGREVLETPLFQATKLLCDQVEKMLLHMKPDAAKILAHIAQSTYWPGLLYALENPDASREDWDSLRAYLLVEYAPDEQKWRLTPLGQQVLELLRSRFGGAS